MSDATSRLNAALEGRYAVERELGEGAMATVYLAKDLKHNRNVALKVLKPELAAMVGAERFLAEIETTANLTHILPLFDLHPDGNRIVTTRLVTSLSSEAPADGTTSPERFLVVVNWFEELQERLGN